MDFYELPEFQKDFKRLAKKYRSLADDLREFRNIVAAKPLSTDKHFAVARIRDGNT